MNNIDKVLFGGPVFVDKTKNVKSLGEFYIKELKRQKDNILLVHSITNEQIAAAQLLSRSIQVAKTLQSFEIKVGDIVAVCSDNEPEFCYITLGTIFIGAAIMPINTSYVENELSDYFTLAPPSIVFTAVENVSRMVNITRKIPSIKQIIIFGNDPSYLSFDDIISEENIFVDFHCKPQNIKENVAVIFSSVGLGGLTKGVQLTQWNLFAAIAEKYLPYSNYYMSVTSYVYLTGFITMIAWIADGHKAVILPKFDENLFLQCIEKYKINSLFLPPPHMAILANTPLVNKYNLRSLHRIIYGSGTVPQNHIEKIKNRFQTSNLQLSQTYGMTESMGILVQPFGGHSKVNSLGFLRCGVWGKIIDINTGRTLGSNEYGQMVFKSPHAMKGYINDAQATEEIIDKNGFLRTGDIGYYDENGEWFFVERLKELIKYNNINLSASELESILLQHPSVKDACVIGVPDALVGELPMAFVVRCGLIEENELIEYVAVKVSSHKFLRGGIQFIEKIPRSLPSGELRKMLRDIASSKDNENLIGKERIL